MSKEKDQKTEINIDLLTASVPTGNTHMVRRTGRPIRRQHGHVVKNALKVA